MTPRPQAHPPSRITVRLTPRGGGNAIDGWETSPAGAVLRARVAAAPADGAANAALVRLVAKALGRSPLLASRSSPARARARRR